jgi:hypothetical protein
LAENDNGGAVGLAMVRRSHFATGTQFVVAGQVARVI